MLVVDPASAVFELAKLATNRIIIVAPYIKSHTLRMLIDVIPASVSDFICITRWLPEDIASGTCDIAIFDDVMQRGGELRVYSHLHAKFYSNSDKCLVGSANLTHRGLGKYIPSNFELLVELPSTFPGIKNWEKNLLELSTTATENLRDQRLEQVEQMQNSAPVRDLPEVENFYKTQFEFWVPTCPNPKYLWILYKGQGEDLRKKIPLSAYEAAQKDFLTLTSILTLQENLSEELFDKHIAEILKQMPIFSKILELAAPSIANTDASSFLAEQLDIDRDSAKLIWDNLKRWAREILSTVLGAAR